MKPTIDPASLDGLMALADVLTWESESDVPGCWTKQYETLVERELTGLAPTDDRASAIVDGLELLPEVRRLAFLRAPLVASRVLGCRSDGSFDAVPVVTALLAELAVFGAEPDFEGSAWTALGDRRVTPLGKAVAGGDYPPLAVAIDAAGPVEFTSSDRAPLSRPDATDLATALPRLPLALEGLRRTAPPAWAFWRSNIDVLALRSAHDRADCFTSLSLAFNARLSLLVNAHAPQATPAVLADALLHEAIHSLLFMHEALVEPMVRPSAPAPELQFKSPWSGRPLHLPALVHACFVWYGLYWFWRKACSSPRWPRTETEANRDRALAGFARPLQEWLPPDQALRLPEDVHRALHALQARLAVDADTSRAARLAH